VSDSRHHVTFDKYLIVLPTCRMPARESSSPSLQPSGAVCVDSLAASGSPGVEVATRLTQSRCLSLFPRHFLGRVTATNTLEEAAMPASCCACTTPRNLPPNLPGDNNAGLWLRCSSSW